MCVCVCVCIEAPQIPSYTKHSNRENIIVFDLRFQGLFTEYSPLE